MFISSVLDSVFRQRSGQTKDYKIGICCFSAELTAFRGKSKDRLNRNQENVSECRVERHLYPLNVVSVS